MRPEVALCERLLTISAVTALVVARVYQLRLPQKPTLPAIRVQAVGEDQSWHLRGPTNVLVTRVQVDAYAAEGSGVDPYAVVTSLADAIDGSWLSGSPPVGLSGWRGTAGGSPPLIEILRVERIDRMPMYEPEEFRLVRIRQDYRVWWRPMT